MEGLEELDGVIIGGERFDVKLAQETEDTCGQCALMERDVVVCRCCAELIGRKSFFVKSEKLTEP